jgi:hypothetical protein
VADIQDEPNEAIRDLLTEEVVAKCSFSPGPWWGFNGIQTLVLTSTKLVVFQGGVAFTADKDMRKTARNDIPLSTITKLTQRRRRGLFGFGNALTFRITMGDRRKAYTTKYVDAGEVLFRSIENARNL